jgi:23S rRNA pseudouridine955/2504/2580 synthase
MKDPRAETAETEFTTIAPAGPARGLDGAVAAHRAHPPAARPHAGHGPPDPGRPKYNDAASSALSEGLKLQLHARRPGPAASVARDPDAGGADQPELKAGFERFGFDRTRPTRTLQEAPLSPIPETGPRP